MKKAFILLLPIYLLCGCKKESVFESYLKFKLDGVEIQCSSNIKAIVTSGYGYGLILNGTWGASSIEFRMNENEELIPRQYSFEGINNRRVTLWIKTSTNTTIYATNGETPFIAANGSGHITITEITSKNVKGTFEFITGLDYFTQSKKTVTNGEFNVKRQ